jgi:ATP-binding cassette subfamily B protein
LSPSERAADRAAFAKACAYLNYSPVAKWTAHIAAVATGLVYVAMLVVLWLFADLMVSRGRLPTYRELTPREQADFRAEVDPNGEKTDDTLSELWRVKVRQITEPIAPGVEPDEADHGILSLIVREQADGRLMTPVLAWFARWNPWMWNAGGGSHTFPPFLIGLLITCAVLALLGAIFAVIQREMAARATIEAATRLRRAVYRHTFRLGTLAFRALGPSEAISIFTRHVEAVSDALYTRLTVFFREPSKFGLLVAFALVVQPYLGLAFLGSAVLIWLIGGQVAAHFRRHGRLATNLASERLTIMRESLMLMRLVKCYLMEQFNQARVERQLSRYAQITLVRFRGEAIYRPLLLLMGLLTGLLLLFVAGALVLAGKLTVAGTVALATALVSLYWPLERWFETRRVLRRGRDAAAEVFKFLERRGDVGQVVGAEFLPPLAKQIEFDSVSLREPGTGRMLLEDVTLTIPSGHRVGLVGSDDLEKHALVYLIPRLLDPSAGEIRIDQHNLRWVTLDSLRAQTAVVLAHNLVFYDTVANNIGCGDTGFTLPQIIEAAKIAHAHHFIQKLPQGYETIIGELGHPLSPSEQFRIALARAILRDPALLIIEEPEAALDEDTKSLLDDTFARILPGRTCIFLPHRISTMRACDTLHLLHKGRIVASGTHKELLGTNKLYRHLHYIEFNEVAEQA